MTILMALGCEDPKYVVLGCDTCAVDGYDSFIEVGPKWVFNNQWAIGISGSTRVRTILENTPEIMKEKTVWELCEKFRQTLDNLGYHHESKNSGAYYYDTWMIIVGKGDISPDGQTWSAIKIYIVRGDFAIIETEEYAIAGSGYAFATGCYEGLHEWVGENRIKVNATSIVKYCLNSAMENDTYCNGDKWVMEWPEKEEEEEQADG